MALIDLERRMLELCFREHVSEAVFAELGDPQPWLLYRELVRERMLREIRVALPRSCALLGEAALERAFCHFLEHDPPRTRFFREIVDSFVESALPLLTAGALPDLLRYERAFWEVRDLEGFSGERPGDFDFDRVPVVSPALRLLRVAHAVHAAPDPDGGYAPGEYLLCIQRQSDAAQPQTWTLTRTTFQLLERWQLGGCSVTQSVQALSRDHGYTLDAAFIDGLCAALAQFIDVGIVLGSRRA
jgi:hypothetical protein